MTNKDYFSAEELEDLMNRYLTDEVKDKIMTNAQVWKAEGVVLGRQEGEEKGRQEGEYKKARRTVLRGCSRGYSVEILADLSELPFQTVVLLANGFATIKKAHEDKKAHEEKAVNIAQLALSAQLTEEEVRYVVESLEKMA